MLYNTGLPMPAASALHLAGWPIESAEGKQKLEEGNLETPACEYVNTLACLAEAWIVLAIMPCGTHRIPLT